MRMTSERRSPGQHATVALVVVALLALIRTTTACSKNEEIVCESSTQNTGPTCNAEYKLCAGGTDRIECTSATGGVTCACIENGATKKTFSSNDACNVTVDTLKKRAEEGCGWTLEAK